MRFYFIAFFFLTIHIHGGMEVEIHERKWSIKIRR